MKRIFILIVVALSSFSGVFAQHLQADNAHKNNPYYSTTDTSRLNVSNAEWKKILSPELYAVSRQQATEKPFTGKYLNNETKGTYYCAVCGNRLFRSDAKFSSTCGWPSFFQPLRKTSDL